MTLIMFTHPQINDNCLFTYLFSPAKYYGKYTGLRKSRGFKGAKPPELGGSKGAAAPLGAFFAYFLSRDRKCTRERKDWQLIRRGLMPPDGVGKAPERTLPRTAAHQLCSAT